MTPCFPDELELDVSQVEKLAKLDDHLLADTKPDEIDADLELFNYLEQVRKSLKEIWAAENYKQTDHFKLPYQFGRFQLLELLGEGGQGIVFRANDPKREIDVAIKLLNTSGRRWDNQRHVRFEREARITSRLHSQNIAAVLEASNIDDTSYLVMPYCPGPSLAQWLTGQQGRPVPILDAVNLIRMINNAVGTCHAHGIIHRDLKPGNVLLFPLNNEIVRDAGLSKFEPRICDFGLSRAEDDERVAITGSQAVLGSRAYMSPEQAEGKQVEVSTATDLWALGVILYEMVTGEKPFGDDGKTLLRILTEDPLSPSLHRFDLPKDLEAIILRCLSKSIRQRYNSIAAFDDDLGLFLEGKPTQARPLKLPQRLVRWAKRRPLIATIVAGLILALCIFAFTVLKYEYQLRDSLALLNEKKTEAENSALQLKDTIYAMTLREVSDLISRGKEDVALDKLLQCVPASDSDSDKREVAWYLLHRKLWNRSLTMLPRKTSVTIRIGRGEQFNSIVSEGDWRLLSWDLQSGASRVLTSDAERDEWGQYIRTQICNFYSYSPSTRIVQCWYPDKSEWRNYHFRINDNVSINSNGMINDMSHDRRWIACAIPSAGLLLQNSQTGHQHLVPWPWLPYSPERYCSFSSDASKVVAVSHSHRPQISVCCVDTACYVGHIDLGATTNLLAMSIHKTNAWFLYDDARLVEIDLNTATIVREHRLKQPASYQFANKHGVVGRLPLFCPDPNTWVLGRTTGEVVRVDLNSGNVSVLTKHQGPVCLVLDAGDKQLITVDGKQARLIDLENGSIINSWATPIELAGGDRSTFLDNGLYYREEKTLVVAGQDGRIAIWRLNGDSTEKTIQHSSKEVWTARFSPDGKTLISAGDGRNLKFWKVQDHQCYRTLNGQIDLVEALAFSNDGKIVVTCGSSRIVRMWSCTNGVLLKELKGQNESSRSIAISPDGNFLATGLRKPKNRRDSMIVIWSLLTGDKIAEISAHEDHVRALVFSSDSKLLYSGSEDQLIKTWDVSSQKLLNTIRDEQEVWHLRLNEGKLISAGNGNIVSTWDADNGKLLQRFRDPDSAIRALTVAPDGRTIITGGEKGPIRFWLAANGQELTSIDVGNEKVLSLDISSDGRYIAAGCVSGKVIMLDARNLSRP